MREISAIPDVKLTSTTTPYPAPQPDPPGKEDRALRRSVAVAVQTLNQAGVAGQGREITFSIDQITRQPVVKVVETSTNEVVQQWPPEYALRLAEETTKQARDSG